MWEYKRIDIKYKLSTDVDIALTNLGTDGWEIVTYNDMKNEVAGSKGGVVHIVAKRPKPIIKEDQRQIL